MSRRCEFESASFPESDFKYERGHGWVHEGVSPLHNADGDLISTPDGGESGGGRLNQMQGLPDIDREDA